MNLSGDSQTSANPGYETRDVNLRAVLWLGFAVAACTVVVAAALWLLLQDFKRRAAARDPALSPLAAEHAGPPPPRLQDTPLADYREFRKREAERLATYGWVDKQRGTVRIPIDRAMQLLVERGERAVAGQGSSEENKAP